MEMMIQLRDEYFEACAELLNRNHVYRNHVNKFIEYLGMPEVNLLKAPLAIDREVVKKCIGYYRDKGEINSRSSMESHLESLKNFYEYLSQNDKVPNIFSGYDYGKFKDEIVGEYGLSEPLERGAYNEEDIKKILLKLDEAIDNFEDETAGIRDEERYLQRILIRLFIKLTLIAPAKRSVIIDIKSLDISENYKRLNINEININIPCGLSRDLCAALKYAEQKNREKIKENDRIFEFIYRHKGKFRGENLNAWFYNIAKDFGVFSDCENRKSFAVEPIRNMAIQMMVDNMVNPVLISKITGITLSMLESTYYSKDWKVKYEDDLDISINKAIAQNSYFCYI